MREIATVAVGTVSRHSLSCLLALLWIARIDAWDVRRLTQVAAQAPRPPAEACRAAVLVPLNQVHLTRRAVRVGLAVIVFLLLLGIPFLSVKWAYPDDRALPPSASSHQVGDSLRSDFSSSFLTRPTQAGAVVPVPQRPESRRTRAPRRRPVAGSDGVRRVAPDGDVRRRHSRSGHRPNCSDGVSAGSAYLTVSRGRRCSLGALRTTARRTARRCRPRDSSRSTGQRGVNRYSMDAIMSRVPWVLGMIAVITLVLLFLLTGSVVLPVKALLLSRPTSLTAAFGALVWIFQEGAFWARWGKRPT